MDREEKVFEHYDAAADNGGKLANTLDNLRYMLLRLYTSGAGEGLMTWPEEDREKFLDMLLDAGEGKDFVPVPSPWPTHRNEDAEVARDLIIVANRYIKTRPEVSKALVAVAKDLKNDV